MEERQVKKIVVGKYGAININIQYFHIIFQYPINLYTCSFEKKSPKSKLNMESFKI